MSRGTRITTLIAAFVPLIVCSVVCLAISAPALFAVCMLSSIAMMFGSLGWHLIFGEQQAIDVAQHYYYVSTPPAQEAVQEAAQYESQYEPVVVNYPPGLYD